MRDLTKSVFSFSWAMSLFGIQQAVNLFTPSKAARAFDNVTGAAKEQFDGALKATFRSGDNLQREIADIIFGDVAGGEFNPSRLARMTSELTRRSAEAVGQVMGAAPCSQQRSTAGATQSEGWGPTTGGAAQQGWGPAPGPNCAQVPSESDGARTTASRGKAN